MENWLATARYMELREQELGKEENFTTKLIKSKPNMKEA